jgi:hypothetical protein
MDGIKPSTAPGRSREGGSFKVPHPFHPLFGRKFDLLTHRRNWGEDRVYYQDEDGGLRSLPAHWTDVVPPDPFCAISAGRAHFRPADLQALANLIQGLQAAERGESPPQKRK